MKIQLKKRFRFRVGVKRGIRRKKEEEGRRTGNSVRAHCGGSKLIAGTVFAAQSFASRNMAY
jgi:hypothetical protein